MNITDAAYATVHDYPGGSEALAPRIGMSAAVLRNKVNPNNDTHHLTLREAQRLVGLTGDKRILHAMASELGDVLLEGNADEESSDMAVLEMMSLLFSSNGELGSVIHRVLSDGALTAGEYSKIETAAYQVRRKVMRLLRRLKGMQEPEEQGGAVVAIRSSRRADAMDRLQAFNDDHVADAIKRHASTRPAHAGLARCERLDCCEPIRPERTAQGARRCDECEEEHQRRNAHFAPWARGR